MTVNDVVQFNERHKWRGSLGIIQKKETDRHLNKKLMKEWDEVRLLLNPNARR